MKFARFFLIVLLLSSTSCKNALKELSETTTDEAVYEDATKDLDASDFNAAITKLTSLSPDYKKRREVVFSLASAYVGRCGFNFATFSTALSNIGATRFFPFLLTQFKGATAAHVDDCTSAESQILSLTKAYDLTALTSSENLFLAFVEFAKIGATFGTYADLDQNGTVDVGFDSCVAAQLPVARAQSLGSGLNLAVAAITQSGSTVASGVLTSFASVCSGLPSGFNFCTVYDPNALTGNLLKAVNALVKENSVVGLGSCVGNVQTCACP